ncbi:helix-turn-helix transcriptional regulator [Castellaniella sp.]|uniref:helix-turn-helix transcriptional regulator n=1 Tax=Castellaniella sp. TaxID=1955812 RepID=UPI003C70FFD3
MTVERALLAGVMSENAWNAALMQVAALAGASYLAVMSRDKGTGQFHVTEPVELSPRLLADYEADFRALNPWNEIDVLSGDGETYLDWDVLGHGFIRRSPFYQEFMRPHGLAHMMGHRVDTEEGTTHYLSIHKQVGEPAFDAGAVAVVSAVHGSVGRVLAVRQKLRGLQQAHAWRRTALDALNFPVMLVDGAGRARQANRAAEAWLSGPGGRLFVEGAGRDRQALLGIVRQALGGPGSPSRLASVRLSFDADHAGTACVAIPVGEGDDPPAVRAGAALLVIWPTRPRAPAQALLRQVFGLSAAEARVAGLMAQGRTPQEIAGLRSVGEATVRTHIKAIFRKTHVHRQHDLARLLTELALVDAPPD